MTTLRGHFDGQRIVLDEPAPTDIPPQTPVKIVFEQDAQETEGDARQVLAEIAKLAVADDDLPVDYSEQHEHYVKGTPRK